MTDRLDPPTYAMPLLALVLLAIAVGGMADLFVFDHLELSFTPHVLLELSLLALSLGTAVFLWRSWATTRSSLDSTVDRLEDQRRERDLWRARAHRYLAGLGAEIDRQLRDWGLTPAERETAVLLLKGLSLKEIGRVAGKSERTARQHAVAVYRKAGLSGRAELSAYFLEDLLAPALEEPNLDAMDTRPVVARPVEPDLVLDRGAAP